VGWVAGQVGHSSFKMIYEHYYKYVKDDRAGGKFMENYREMQKKTPAKWSQNGHTPQGIFMNNKLKQKVKWSGRLDLIPACRLWLPNMGTLLDRMANSRRISHGPASRQGIYCIESY